METVGFMAIFTGYWPNAKNVKAPKQQELWTEIIDGIPDDLLTYAVKRYARQAKFPPTVMEFERHLWPLMDAWAARNPANSLGAEWLRRQAAWQKAAEEDHKPPLLRTCGGCRFTIRSEDEIPPKRFETDGGLVYKHGEDGLWYACRCPQCGSAARHHPSTRGSAPLARYTAPISLPLPPRDELHLWKPLEDTPGGPLWDVVVENRLLTGEDPRFLACFAWQNEAIANSRSKINALIAAEQEKHDADLLAERKAAVDANRKAREERKAAAIEGPKQVLMLMEPPTGESEPGSDPQEPAPAADATPDPAYNDPAADVDPDDSVPF